MRVVGSDGDSEDWLGAGGQLAERFESLGRTLLLHGLTDRAVQAILLADGPLEIELHREEGDARLLVRWGGSVAVNTRVPIPAPQPIYPGPWFRPAPESRMGVEEALQGQGAVFAVGDPADPEFYRAGLHGDGLGARPLCAWLPPQPLADRYSRLKLRVDSDAPPAQLRALAEAGATVLLRAGRRWQDKVEAALTALVGCARLGLTMAAGDVESGVELAERHDLKVIEIEGASEVPFAVAYFRLSAAREVWVSPLGDGGAWIRPVPAQWVSKLLAEHQLTSASAADAALWPSATTLWVPPEAVLRMRQRAARLSLAGGHPPPLVGALGGRTPGGLWCALASGPALLDVPGPAPLEWVQVTLAGAAALERAALLRAQGLVLPHD